jgi:hypothetical protein
LVAGEVLDAEVSARLATGLPNCRLSYAGCKAMKGKVDLALAAVAVLLVVTVVAVSTHGWLWSVDEFRYKRMINSLPAPPGWMPDTNIVHTSPDYPRAARRYEVQGEHEAVAAFFMATLPKLGWSLVGERRIRAQPGSPGYAFVSRFAFDNPRDRCLEVKIASFSEQPGMELGQRVDVELHLLDKRSSVGGSITNFCRIFENSRS